MALRLTDTELLQRPLSLTSLREIYADESALSTLRRVRSRWPNICSVCSTSDHLAMPDARALLVSVKPVYADLLLSGRKTVELRRVRPNVEPGCLVLLYASSPQMEMVATARIATIDSGEIDTIWTRYAEATGLDRATYDRYFTDRPSAVAISLIDVQALRHSVPLAELRRRLSGFRPPQSFRYLPGAEAAVVI